MKLTNEDEIIDDFGITSYNKWFQLLSSDNQLIYQKNIIQ